MRLQQFFLFFFLCTAGFSQNGITDHPQWQIKPVYSAGFILVHRISIGHLVKGYPGTFELNISKPTLGDYLWHCENNRPEVGLSLQCMDFKNPQQLGYAYTLAPYIEVPLNEKVKSSRVIMRICWGATYITKPYDRVLNHKNVAIGSHVNAFVQFRWFWHLQINDYLRFEPGLSFTHASNGKARNPNLGLNVVSVSAGLNMLLPSRHKVPAFDSINYCTRVKKKNEILINAAFGLNERAYFDRRMMKSYLLALGYQRNIRNTHKFNLGSDIYLDGNYVVDYQNHYAREPVFPEQLRISLRGGYSYNIGRLSFPVEIGYYVYKKTKPDASVVSRLGIRYYASNGVVASFGLRTHFAVAYTFEYGLGYRFFL